MSRYDHHFLRFAPLVLLTALVLGGCRRGDQPAVDDDTIPAHVESQLLEPPGHAPGEPHPFTECPDGACPREQPAYLFSGEFHESVVDLRVASCGVGLDLVWARRYRSRVILPDGQTPLGNNWDHSYNIYLHLPDGDSVDSSIVVHDGNARPAAFERDAEREVWSSPGYHREGSFDIVDPQGLALTTIHEYDVACNEVRRIDPRGIDTIYVYNQRDQVIRELGPLETCPEACGGGSPVRTYTDRHYDANMNLVRVDYEARDCDGSVQGDGVVSTHYEYDALGELIATRSEIGDGNELVNEFVLDANREQVLLRYGEAARGADPSNTSTTVYDERGYVFRETRGAGSEAMSTVQHEYDPNGNDIDHMGAVVLHEIAHNINAIGDKKINKNTMGTESEVMRYAKNHPAGASWNAANYEHFGRTR